MKSKNIKRNDEILKIIIEEYIATAKPIGSVYLIQKYSLNISSATIRNVMSNLESEGYLVKSHTSSGRIPSKKGYQYYADNLTSNIEDDLKYKIDKIFLDRKKSISETIDEAISLISQISELTIVTNDLNVHETLKSITLTPLSKQEALIVIVTSSKNIQTKTIHINDFYDMEDLIIAIRVFQDRLIDLPLKDVPDTLNVIAPELSKAINNYEELIKTFVNNIFSDYIYKTKNKVFGKSYLINSEDIDRSELAHLINMVENQSIWKSMNEISNSKENLKIEVLPNNIALFSHKVKGTNISKEISIVSSSRTNYSKAKNILLMINNYINEKKNQERSENE